MRSIKQPGPPAPERVQWAEARGRAFSFTLEPGLTLLEAARRGFAAQGFAGGTLNIKGGTLGAFGYVMPALSKTGENAAFYSDTFRPAGLTRLKLATMTLGERDGAPFFHCHGLWTAADGHSSGGHMLPEETFVAKPFEVDAFGIDGAVFAAEPDPETNFKLFGPMPVAFSSEVETGSRQENASKSRSRSGKADAKPTRCGCGRTRILPAVSKAFAASAASQRQKSAAASARPSARALSGAVSLSPLRPSLR